MKNKLQLYPYNKPVYQWDKETIEPTFGEYYQKYDKTSVFRNNAYYGKLPNTGEEFEDPVFLCKYQIDNSVFTPSEYTEKTVYQVEPKKLRRVYIKYNPEDTNYYEKFYDITDESYKNYDYIEQGYAYAVPYDFSGENLEYIAQKTYPNTYFYVDDYKLDIKSQLKT